jgi:hypothetical protein
LCVGKYWSVRAGQNYRALGIELEKGILWFWIGIHAEYKPLIENRFWERLFFYMQIIYF